MGPSNSQRGKTLFVSAAPRRQGTWTTRSWRTLVGRTRTPSWSGLETGSPDGEALGEVEVTPMPTHEFLLLPEKDNDYSGYMNHFNDLNALKLNDDIVLYMMDTLRWVPSINPANPNQWCGYGLNYYGPTVINKTGAEKTARLLRLWAALLQEGPDALELTGDVVGLAGVAADEEGVGLGRGEGRDEGLDVGGAEEVQVQVGQPGELHPLILSARRDTETDEQESGGRKARRLLLHMVDHAD